MKTVTIQIGNSDDKLTQKRWSQYVIRLSGIIETCGLETHFSGGSNPTAKWQNYCWVVIIYEAKIPIVLKHLTQLRKEFDQESIAVTIGKKEYVARAGASSVCV